MMDSEAPETKKCPYCGRMTSAKANFCYWCARELAARPERPDASSSSMKKANIAWLWVVLGVVVLAGILLVLFLR